jgi:uncharacterized protein (TIGR03790 family)
MVTIGYCEDGSSVVVIYNSLAPESKEVALHYSKLRNVPANQIFGFDLSSDETITRKDYQLKLEIPLLKKLFDTKLFESYTNQGKVMLPPSRSKIRYAVLCYGVPVKILEDKNVVSKDDGQMPQELKRNEASVDSELACLPRGPFTYRLDGPLLNPVFMTTNSDLIHPTNGGLIVTRLDGPTSKIAMSLVDKAIEAEKNGLWGRAYFDLRGITNGALAEGDKWLSESAFWCARLGFETVVDTSPTTFSTDFPMSHIAIYAGWYDDNVSGPFLKDSVEFMPGAFAYHLHSFSCEKLRTTSARWVGPFLAKGVTVTMGSVNEPGLGGTPYIPVFLTQFLLRGSTFGEAFITSQHAVSWQNVAIGDPLYRPFKKNLEEWQNELEKADSKYLEWVYLRWANINLSAGRKPMNVIDYLEKEKITRKSAVLQEKLAELYLSENKFDDSLNYLELAFKNKCSLNQRIRIALNYTDTLISLSREDKALAFLKGVQKTYPQLFENKLIKDKFQTLSQKLGNK